MASTMHSEILAISRPIHDLLRTPTVDGQPRQARLLARFRRAIDLTLDGTIIALITPEVAIGPFHIEVTPLPKLRAAAPLPILWYQRVLHIDTWAFRFTDKTRIWEPQPDWGKMRIGRRQQTFFLQTLRDFRPGQRDMSTLTTTGGCLLPGETQSSLIAAITHEDLAIIRQEAASLSGRGPGLTPSGDDYLAGLMLALWAIHNPSYRRITETIYHAAEGRTNQISLAFLRAAARGQMDERWQDLLKSLSPCAETDRDWRTAIKRHLTSIYTFGATSGQDTLSGFAAGLQLN